MGQVTIENVGSRLKKARADAKTGTKKQKAAAEARATRYATMRKNWTDAGYISKVGITPKGKRFMKGKAAASEERRVAKEKALAKEKRAAKRSGKKATPKIAPSKAKAAKRGKSAAKAVGIKPKSKGGAKKRTTKASSRNLF